MSWPISRLKIWLGFSMNGNVRPGTPNVPGRLALVGVLAAPALVPRLLPVVPPVGVVGVALNSDWVLARAFLTILPASLGLCGRRAPAPSTEKLPPSVRPLSGM